MRHAATLATVLAFCLPAMAAEPPGTHDGQVRAGDDGTFVAWDSEAGVWRDPLEFWLAFAERRGGLTWGRRANYPPYDEVSEHDTLLVEAEGGPCLMEFFHRRWRRARDVWRWDEGFNRYGGCPRVFD